MALCLGRRAAPILPGPVTVGQPSPGLREVTGGRLAFDFMVDLGRPVQEATNAGDGGANTRRGEQDLRPRTFRSPPSASIKPEIARATRNHRARHPAPTRQRPRAGALGGRSTLQPDRRPTPALWSSPSRAKDGRLRRFRREPDDLCGQCAGGTEGTGEIRFSFRLVGRTTCGMSLISGEARLRPRSFVPSLSRAARLSSGPPGQRRAWRGRRHYRLLGAWNTRDRRCRGPWRGERVCILSRFEYCGRLEEMSLATSRQPVSPRARRPKTSRWICPARFPARALCHPQRREYAFREVIADAVGRSSVGGGLRVEIAPLRRRPAGGRRVLGCRPETSLGSRR